MDEITKGFSKLEDPDLVINSEEFILLYVYLLNEDTDCWRPVPAIKVNDSEYVLQGFEIHNPEDEEWEFLPGSHVNAKKKIFSNGKQVLVATKLQDEI